MWSLIKSIDPDTMSCLPKYFTFPSSDHHHPVPHHRIGWTILTDLFITREYITCFTSITLMLPFRTLLTRHSCQTSPLILMQRNKIHWGHATSPDLVFWKTQPIALFPNSEFNSGGCWSGSITIVDGIPIILYTGSVYYGASFKTASVL